MPYELRIDSFSTRDIEKLKTPWLVAKKVEEITDSVIVLQCMHGWGDTVYSTIGMNAIYLALQEELSQQKKPGNPHFYAITPLPQLFAHLPYVRCIKPKSTELRTQGKNAERKDITRYWHQHPVVKGNGMIVRLDVNYFTRFGGDENWTVAENMLMPVISGTQIAWDLRRFPMSMTLPKFDVELPAWAKEPFVLLRPNVIRREWPAHPRNCKAKYLKQAIRMVKDRFRLPVVSIADADGTHEYIEQSMPADYEYHRGEFNLEQMVELVRRAFLCLGSQGFISGWSMAAKTKCVIILAGSGWENNPSRLTHPKLDTSSVSFVVPDNHCMCRGYRCQKCDKTIVNFEQKFVTALNQIGINY